MLIILHFENSFLNTLLTFKRCILRLHGSTSVVIKCFFCGYFTLYIMKHNDFIFYILSNSKFYSIINSMYFIHIILFSLNIYGVRYIYKIFP